MTAALHAGSRFVAILQGLPAATIAPGRIEFARPAAAAELPMVAVAIADAHEFRLGIVDLVLLAGIAPAQWAATTGRGVDCELRIEVWAADSAHIGALDSAVVARVESEALALREAGFLKLTLRSFGPGQLQPLGNESAKVMPLAYAARFESLFTPEPSGASMALSLALGWVSLEQGCETLIRCRRWRCRRPGRAHLTSATPTAADAPSPLTAGSGATAVAASCARQRGGIGGGSSRRLTRSPGSHTLGDRPSKC